MTDAEFFALFGLKWTTDVNAENKIQVFNELVSLFDSLHDFGAFGSVYDYVTTSGAVFITNRKTIFNHLRNGYPILKNHEIISTTNSQLHSYSNGFHLKASLSKAKLEDAFYTYAKSSLMGGRAKSDDLNKDALTIKILNDYFGNNIVFSVDTQKKLFDSKPVIDKETYQVFDREKQCDPASHTKAPGGNVRLLIEDPTINPSREYLEVPGISKATVSGGEILKPLLRIKLINEDGNGAANTIEGFGSTHPNNVTNVNNQLKAIIVAGHVADMPNNVSITPGIGFYKDAGIKNYGLDAANNKKKYILDVRRKLAQKRLGDQMQVLACKQTINYQGGITVTNPIFVSIDRMAIAFAIANGVNCIYSNKGDLTLFKGSAKTVVTGALPQFGGEATNAPKKNQMGGIREEWDILSEDLKKSPIHIMNIFMYTLVEIHWFLFQRKVFSEFVSTSNITSIDHNDTYIVRSFHNDPASEAKIIIDELNSDCLVHINNNRETWKITKSQGAYILKRDNDEKARLSLEELVGQVEKVGEGMEGGGKNKDFLKTLAQYDLLTLCDEEQTRIWYDEFYTRDDGFTFHIPTFYELNAFFQILFEENIEYMLIFSFLKNSSDPFSKDVLYAIERILDYMEISVPYDTEVDKVSEAVLLDVLKSASEKSKEYGHSISTLKGSELLDYLFEHNLTPLYFHNVFSEKYPPVRVKKPVTTTYTSKMLSRKRRYNTNVPFERRVLVKAIGGKKKYKGSPRRRTLRKTRKHR
jgi:hypothetical protein